MSAPDLPILPPKAERWKVFAPELAKVKDKALREWAAGLLCDAPEYFWTVPASITGKYHAPDDLDVCGLVHHTKKVAYFGMELVRSLAIEEEEDKVIIACLLHDIVKYGLSDIRDTSKASYDLFHFHPQNGAQFILSRTPNPTEAQVEIARMVACHNGPWGPDDVKPVTKNEYAVHLADYCGSRQKVVMRPLEGEEFLWAQR
jgi:hypothetical protein